MKVSHRQPRERRSGKKKRSEKGKDFFFHSMCGYCAPEIEYECVLNHLCMSRVRYVPCWRMKDSLMLGSRIIVGGPIASGVPLCTGVVLSRVERQSYNWEDEFSSYRLPR